MSNDHRHEHVPATAKHHRASEHEAPAYQEEHAPRLPAHQQPTMGRRASILALQRAVGNQAVNQLLTRQYDRSLVVNRQNIQREFVVSDENDGPDAYLDEIDQYVRSLNEPWLTALINSPRVILTVNAQRRVAALQAAYEGKTVVTRVNGQLLDNQARSVQEWHQMLAGANQVMIGMNILPRDGQQIGDILAVVMHELYLHVRPISNSLNALEGSHLTEATAAHVDSALAGEDAQHSDPNAWDTYFQRAQQRGRVWIASNQPELVKQGVELILSAVNDLMTHVNPATQGTPEDRAPTMPVEERQRLFGEADQVGTEMGQFQQAHPEIWPEESDSE